MGNLQINQLPAGTPANADVMPFQTAGGTTKQSSAQAFGYLPVRGGIGRLFFAGVSYVWDGYAVNGQRTGWAMVIREMLGLDSQDRVVTTQIPKQSAGAADQTTLVALGVDDGWVSSISYWSNGGVTGQNTNYLQLWAEFPTLFGYASNLGAFTQYSLTLGNNLNDHQENVIYWESIGSTGGYSRYWWNTVAGGKGTYPSALPGGSVVRFTQHQVGSGLADPGGVLTVRVSDRVRNVAVFGSCVTRSGIFHGGWATMSARMYGSKAPGVEVNVQKAVPANLVSVTTATGTPGTFTKTSHGLTAGTPITLSSIVTTTGISSGTQYYVNGTITANTFQISTDSGGSSMVTLGGGAGSCTVQVSLTVDTISLGSVGVLAGMQIALNGQTVVMSTTPQNFGTVIGINPTATPISAGAQGYIIQVPGATVGYESQSPTHVAMLQWGTNDTNSTYQTLAGVTIDPWDQYGYAEAMRSCIAMNLCSYYKFDCTAGNIVYANGSGGGTWTDAYGGSAPAWGQFTHNVKKFSGTATSATATIQLAPAFEGGTVDVFFLALGGTGHGGAATIKVDGANPPAGACTVDTNSISAQPSWAFPTCVLSGTTITKNGAFTPEDIGKFVFGTGITNGTFITTVASDGNSCTTSASMTGGTVTVTLCGFLPMVKRLTGLSAGAHTITITPSTPTQFLFFMGYGIEATNPTAGVIVANNMRVPNTQYNDTRITTSNNQLAAIVAGTATWPVGNTSSNEPALPSSVLIADVDTAINKVSSYFGIDGLHPNTRGNLTIAQTVYQQVVKLSAAQLMAR